MSDNTKPIPKSLHTVTVLVRMTKMWRETGVDPDETVAESLEAILSNLGLADKPDTYDLTKAALKQLEG